MVDDGSITVLIHSYRRGETPEDVAQQLFQRYFSKLEYVARARIAGLRLRDRDEQDVAANVMCQFFLAVRDGRFPRLNDRHDLWQILMMILERRVVDIRRKKPEPVCGESGISPPSEEDSHCGGMGMVPGLEPTPGTIVQLEEELQRRLEQLPQGLRQVAIWRLEGHSNAEIADKLNRSIKRVEAKLQLIRQIWSETGEIPPKNAR
jgi:DNA-directed RNA polymerase specialized sigma24 family protein